MKMIGQLLFSEETIRKAIEKIADQIAQAHPQKAFQILAVLQGAAPFVSALAKELRLRECLFSQFSLTVQRSRGGAQLGDPILVSDLAYINSQRPIIICDELCDEGETLKFVRNYLIEEFKVQESLIHTAALVTKNKVQGVLNWHGLEAPDLWLYGFGMDLDLSLPETRSLKEIYRVDPEKVYAL